MLNSLPQSLATIENGQLVVTQEAGGPSKYKSSRTFSMENGELVLIMKNLDKGVTAKRFLKKV